MIGFIYIGHGKYGVAGTNRCNFSIRVENGLRLAQESKETAYADEDYFTMLA